jgi:predicted phosphoribosyltransferase
MDFLNRSDAGLRLAKALAAYAAADAVVLALPRGGVPVAAQVARALHAPLDLIMVRKLGLPFQPEVAMGAIADRGRGDPTVVWDDWTLEAMPVAADVRRAIYERESTELERRRALNLRGREPLPVSGRTAIVIDDGLATGATMEAALLAIRQEHPKTLVLAVPVAPAGTLQRLEGLVDEVVCLETPPRFVSVGFHYGDFRQVSDAEVVAALSQAPADRRRLRA